MDWTLVAVTIVAAYDVSEDGPRARLAALLQAYGDRIQYSVFLLTLGEDDLNDVRSRALTIIDPEIDSLYLLRQCIGCWHDVQCIGQALKPTPDLCWIAL